MASSSRAFKDTVYQHFARPDKSVASAKRLELLDILCQGPRTVEVLARQAEISVANASMKASLNGVIHLSILDGWWIEGFNVENGWAFEGKDDTHDAEAIYDILAKEAIPLYYNIGDDGIPHNWVNKMKEAIKSIAPSFCSRRMVKEYAINFYQKALKASS